jgi:hypothetical protein
MVRVVEVQLGREVMQESQRSSQQLRSMKRRVEQQWQGTAVAVTLTQWAQVCMCVWGAAYTVM